MPKLVMPAAAQLSPLPWHVTALMTAGEQLARDVAAAQVEGTAERRLRGVLPSQSRQDAFYAQEFAAATLALGGPRGAPDADWGFSPLRSRFERDLARGGFPGTLVGLQVMVESVGEEVLVRTEASISATGGVARRLHALIAGQESVHHSFGTRTLERMLAAGAADRQPLAEAGAEYRLLLERLLADSADMLDECAIPVNDFRAVVAASISDWLLTGRAP